MNIKLLFLRSFSYFFLVISRLRAVVCIWSHCLYSTTQMASVYTIRYFFYIQCYLNSLICFIYIALCKNTKNYEKGNTAIRSTIDQRAYHTIILSYYENNSNYRMQETISGLLVGPSYTYVFTSCTCTYHTLYNKYSIYIIRLFAVRRACSVIGHNVSWINIHITY